MGEVWSKTQEHHDNRTTDFYSKVQVSSESRSRNTQNSTQLSVQLSIVTVVYIREP